MVLLKTPDRITIYYDYDEPRYNPETGEYESSNGTEIVLPCLITTMSKSRQSEEYGSRTDHVVSVRFMNDVSEFQRAKIGDDEYVMIENRDTLKKEAVHLKRVGRNG